MFLSYSTLNKEKGFVYICIYIAAQKSDFSPKRKNNGQKASGL
jgi:hypothetical protein